MPEGDFPYSLDAGEDASVADPPTYSVGAEQFVEQVFDGIPLSSYRLIRRLLRVTDVPPVGRFNEGQERKLVLRVSHFSGSGHDSEALPLVT